MSEIVKPVEVTPPRKIRVVLKESKSTWVCHFCGKSRHICPNCFKLQVAKRANKPKVPVP